MIPAKKSLGQNFLNSPGAIAKIVEAAELALGDVVLEVGPGKGALTEKLLERGVRVVAVEKDDRLIPFLQEKFGNNPNFSLIHGDILELMGTQAVIPEYSSGIQTQLEPGSRIKSGMTLPAQYKLVANLPYYITGVFLRLLCESANPPSLAVLMLQREVADRILVRDGKQSILSLSILAYGSPSLVTHVPAGAFSPVPSVDSSVVKIAGLSKLFFEKEGITEKAFFDTVTRGFAHKRKILKGNLDISEEKLEKCAVPAKSRAEELALPQWACLTRELS